MPWVEVFAVFVVSHAVGDFLLQTDWQARNKHGGLTGSRTQSLALLSHVTTYTLAFVPCFIWLWSSLHAWVFVLAVAIFIPHYIQDDGRVLDAYARTVKKADIKTNQSLGLALDQAFHLLALFVTALIVGR
jgi:Protein of unknown function (DUF3307)